MTDANEPSSVTLITRAEAKAAGLPTFTKCKPCKKYGHPAERYTSMGGCVACHVMASQNSREIGRERRMASETNTFDGDPCRKCGSTERYVVSGQCVACAKNYNQEKSSGERAVSVELGVNTFIGRACKVCGKTERYIVGGRCVSCTLDRGKITARENAPRTAAYARQWRANNPTKARAATRKWHNNNPEAVRAIDHTKRARKRSAPGRYTAQDILDIFRRQKGKCAYCRTSIKRGYHVDHIIPLAKGGTNWPRNIQLTCGKCNVRKNATDPIEYAQRIGLLL